MSDGVDSPDPHRAVERAVLRAAAARDAGITDGQRRERGIVHTPLEVARFVARRSDAALRELGHPGGLADPDVALIDLACGPGVFLAAAMAVADRGAPRVAVGLELDGAVASQARGTLRPAAHTAGWPLRIETVDTLAGPPPLTEAERRHATLVVLGNPPWAGRTANRGARFTDALLGDFRREPDGAPLRERKIGVLSDDYVRFWRWASEVARGAERAAVVALVTNGSFLDGPVHRGMRGALLRWFERLDVVDLGGSALVARRGDADENVFGVRPAAAITVAVRPPSKDETRVGRVRYATLRGTRERKLARLAAGDVVLAPVTVRAPMLRLTPEPPEAPEYVRWPGLPELVPFHREGLQTNRDAFCVDTDPERLRARLLGFAAGEPGPWPGRADLSSRHYNPEEAREAVRRTLGEQGPDHLIRRVAYRPFDDRWVAAIPKLCHRPRLPLLAAVDASELSLLTVRKDRGERPWSHFAITRHAADNCYLSSRSSCRTRAFPTHRPDGSPNLDRARVSAWAPALGAVPPPRELLRYAACVLASSTYRSRFDAHLRGDYPRIPPPPSEAAFRACMNAGARLESAFCGPLVGSTPGQLSLPPLELGHHRLRESRVPSVLRLREALAECERAAALLWGR